MDGAVLHIRFADAVAALRPRLVRYARALTRNPDAAEDLAQDAVLRALTHEARFQPGTDLRAWLFTILHNEHVNAVRKSVRRGQQVDITDCHDALLSTGACQSGGIETQEARDAIASLPPEMRAALLLIGMDGRRYDSAAAICRVPVGTMRSRLSRARAALREMGATP